ncbi:MAG: putative DNA-binding protein (MmcQ/YjbR family) [Paraglaciecola sp.]|jgi:predicted DNA-binding protein (MmcQ/YjbR family)
MDHQQVLLYLLSKPEAVEEFPFGPDMAVLKVKHKTFATMSLAKGDEKNKNLWWVNLKCDPHEAVMLRDIFPAIVPGYHMNKLHWNTIKLDNSIPYKEILRMIDNSYNLVVGNMSKQDQQSIVHL